MFRSHSLLIVFVLWAAGLCAAAQFAKFALVLPELAQLYPDTNATLGFLVSSISLVGAVFGLSAGVVATRFNFRHLLVVALVVGAAVSVIQSLGLPIIWLLASRVLEGATHLAIVVAAPTLIAMNSNDQLRASAMTLWGTFFGVAFVLTAWLGLPLVQTGGVQALFLVHGLCTGLIAILVVVVVPRFREPATAPLAERLPIASLSMLQEHRRAWISPFIAAPAAGWLFYTLTFVALLAILPAMMLPEERSSTAIVLPIASIASSMTIGVFLLRRLAAVHVVSAGFIAAIVAAPLVLIVPGEPFPAVALFAALGLVQGASFAAIPQLNPDRNQQVRAYGALAQSGNIGNLCGTPLSLAVLGAGGDTALMVLVIMCYVAAVTVHYLLAMRRRMFNGNVDS